MGRVVIVGAGICGLLAGARLQASGWQVTILEQQPRPGGRLRSERRGAAAFDSGAQFFSVRAPAFAALVEQWRVAGLAEQWCSGFAASDARFPQQAPIAVEDGFPRYRIAGGMDRLALHLAAGLDVRCGSEVEQLDAAAGRLALQVRAPSGPATVHADAAILTPPVPLALALIAAGSQQRALDPAVLARLASVAYAPCLCLTLDYPGAAGPAIPAPGAVRLADGPLSWISSQRAKGLRSVGEGIVIHAAAPWSAAHMHEGDAALTATMLSLAAPLLAGWSGGDWSSPLAATVTRWQHSLATATLAEPSLAVDLGAAVIFAGDAFGAQPRVEGAALSGLAAAAALCAGTFPR
jgi:predicted NAD/FAD-dependent oxidoreductase